MKVKYIYDFIDSFAPFRDQCEWDNSGLLLGDMNCDFSKIGFSLDITGETVDNAIAEGCDLIVTHHPVIFRPVNSIGYDSLVSKLIKNNMALEKRIKKKEKEIEKIILDNKKLNNKIASQEQNSENFLRQIEKWANKQSYIKNNDNELEEQKEGKEEQ